MPVKENHIAAARQAYDRSVALITALDESFLASSPNHGYDSAITLYQFDLILQAVLLHMALIDGNFHRLERKLIARLSEYGDLMHYLRREGTFGPIRWESIPRLTETEQQHLLAHLPGLLARTCATFVRPLALTDMEEENVDFLARLEEELLTIARCMSRVDGDERTEELDAYLHSVSHLLTRRWREIREDID